MRVLSGTVHRADCDHHLAKKKRLSALGRPMAWQLWPRRYPEDRSFNAVTHLRPSEIRRRDARPKEGGGGRLIV